MIKQWKDGNPKKLLKGHARHHNGLRMVVGCGVPIVAIVLLPLFGLSETAIVAIGVGGMIVFHGAMMGGSLSNTRSRNTRDAETLHNAR
ncbi:MAG TPA: hypothetical protein VMW87_05890 [Spirochaetia bacterium]|nr:hypothetical protein [Spirochaetia bacterium]